MKAAFKILISFIVLILLVGTTIYFIAPSEINVTQEIKIFSPKKIVFDQVNNFKKWHAWSPRVAKDSSISYEYGDTNIGKAAFYSWSGSPELTGKGTMKILNSAPADSIIIDLKFNDWSSNPTVKWEFKSTEQGFTKVSWNSYESLSNPFQRIMTYFMVDTALIAADFLYGLEQIKAICEADSKYNTTAAEVVTSNEMLILSKKIGCSYAEIETEMTNGYAALLDALAKQMKKPSGYPLCIRHNAEDPNMLSIEIGLPIEEQIETEEGITCAKIASTKTVKVIHNGPHSLINKSYEAANKYISNNSLEKNGSPWENYITSPSEPEDKTKWLTEIIIPIK